MLRKFKNLRSSSRDQGELAADPTSENAIETGAAALSATGVMIEQSQRSYYEEVTARVGQLMSAQAALLRDSVVRGVPSSDLASLVADAMNSGALPRVVQNPLVSRNYVGLYLLDGLVRPEDLRVSAEMIPERKIPSPDPRIPERVLEPHFEWNISPDTPITTASDPDRLQVEYIGSLPRIESGEPVDIAVLEKIDAHMTVSIEA